MGEEEETILDLEEFKAKQLIYIEKHLSVLNKNMYYFNLFLQVAIIYMIIGLTLGLLTYSKIL